MHMYQTNIYYGQFSIFTTSVGLDALIPMSAFQNFTKIACNATARVTFDAALWQSQIAVSSTNEANVTKGIVNNKAAGWCVG